MSSQDVFPRRGWRLPCGRDDGCPIEHGLVGLTLTAEIGFVLRVYYLRLYFSRVIPMVATVRELFEEGARGRFPPNHPVKFVRGVRQPGRGAFSWRGAPWRRCGGLRCD